MDASYSKLKEEYWNREELHHGRLNLTKGREVKFYLIDFTFIVQKYVQYFEEY